MNPFRRTALVLPLLLLGCKAGPSAFDRRSGVDQHLEDTADVANLPHLPEAAEVEAYDMSPNGSEPPGASDAGSGAHEAMTAGSEAVAASGPGSQPPDPPPPSVVVDGEAPRFERPERVRGIYLNAWASGSRRRMDDLLDLARRTEINTFVIDIKDATGYVSHRTEVPMAREIGATGEVRIRDVRGLLARLHAEGIYPVARIVVVKDPLLSAAHPEMAVQDTAGGAFVDAKGIVWLNPYDRGVWAYHVALAAEVAALGFPEIQWDYVRFPDITADDKARTVYPGAGGVPKAQAIADFLAYSREALSDLDVTVTADVFGVTTSASRDVGIGQVWESVIGSVDIALPMVYPSHYWKGSFGFDSPNAHPYEVVKRAIEDALRRSAEVEGAGATRPWLQDFTLGPPRYEAPEVRAQIQAAYDAGVQEWILWNPGSRYTTDALEPEAGFEREPAMRIAGRIVPVSERWTVLDSIRLAKIAAETADTLTGAATADTVPVAVPADTVPMAVPADTVTKRPPPVDSVRGPGKPSDTVRVDTLRPGGPAARDPAGPTRR